MLLIIVALQLCMTPQPALAQTPDVIYVDHDATGDDSGTSWANAYTDLQKALDDPAAASSEIWVAEGIYVPTKQTGDSERSATFALGPGMAIYGGFEGIEGSLAARDWLNNVTVLSGQAGTFRVLHVVTALGTADPTSTLDGFTISGGLADLSSTESRGAGIYCSGCRTTFRNLRIRNNDAVGLGGAIIILSSSPTFTNVEISGNSANWGAGVYANSSSVSFANASFHENVATTYGGAAYIVGGTPRFSGVTIVANSAATAGGAFYITNNSVPAISNAILWSNSAFSGYQIHNQSTVPQISFSLIEDAFDSSGNWVSAIGSEGDGNIDAAIPGFADADTGDFRLKPGSPAIDAGDPITTTLPFTDLDGYPRLSDGDTVPGPRVDMGAYEWPGYGLAIHKSGSGEVTNDPPGTHFPPASGVTLTATPADGWDFSGWSGDATGNEPVTTITMTASMVVTATFTSPAAVTMGSLNARSTPSGMLVTWETASEIDMLGVYLRRRTLSDGPWIDLNGGELIPVQGPGQLMGASYTYLDAGVTAGEKYTYLLETVGFGPLASGPDTMHTVDVLHWGYFWWLPILGGYHVFGP
ncbi:MAG: choice-of-anchor Q domain-containing protein [Anaerolineae bacterium]